MNHFDQLYTPPQNKLWQGRHDAKAGEYFYQLVQMCDLNHLSDQKEMAYAILGFACDAGVQRNLGRTGAAQGPDAIRKALARLPIHNFNRKLYDVGNIVCENNELEAAQELLSNAVSQLHSLGIFPIVLGGGHETAWGHYQGLYQHHQTALPILNFDAHFDLRDLLPNNQGNSGTPFHQIAKWCEKNAEHFDYNCIGIQSFGNTQSLFERAHALKTNYLLAEEIYLKGQRCVTHFIEKILHRVDKLYVTFCLDVLSSAYAPGVSAPQPLGLSPWQILPALRQLATSGKIAGFDIVEYAPCFDPDERTAKLAALLIGDFLITTASK